VITSSNEFALDPGFAEGFLETTRAYFEQGPSASASESRAPIDHDVTPLPVLERGTGARPMLHVLGPDSI
jgi:hypothetical protein